MNQNQLSASTAIPQNRRMLQMSLTGNLGPCSGFDRAIPNSVIPYLSNKTWPKMKKKQLTRQVRTNHILWQEMVECFPKVFLLVLPTTHHTSKEKRKVKKNLGVKLSRKINSNSSFTTGNNCISDHCTTRCLYFFR